MAGPERSENSGFSINPVPVLQRSQRSVGGQHTDNVTTAVIERYGLWESREHWDEF